MAKILYVASRVPFPRVGGREYMISQSLEFLASEHEVTAVFFRRKNDGLHEEKTLALGVKNVLYVDLPGALGVVKSILARPDFSIQENLYYSKKIGEEISAIVSTVGPECVVCDMLRVSQYFYNYPIPLVVDLDDLLSERYKKMLVSSSAGYSVLGTYANNVPKFFKWAERYVRGFALRYEADRISKSECVAYHKADRVILTSPKEATYLNGLNRSDKAVGIPQYFDVLPCGAAGKNIVFLGNMETAQNLESLRFLCSFLGPLLDELSVSMHVVGKYDERAVAIVGSLSGKVILEGFVDDIKQVFNNSCIALMPVAFGTGIKTKVLEALAMGIPVVTNAVGVEGLSAVNGRDLIVSEAPEDIIQKVKMLFYRPELRESLARNGLSYIENSHSYNILKGEYLKVVEQAMISREESL